MTTAPRADRSTALSTTLASFAAGSLLGVLLSVALSYEPAAGRKPAAAPRPRVACTVAVALA